MIFTDEQSISYQSNRSLTFGWAAAVAVLGVLVFLAILAMAVRDAFIAAIPALSYIIGQLLVAVGLFGGIAFVGLGWVYLHDKHRDRYGNLPPRRPRVRRLRREAHYTLYVDAPDDPRRVQRATARALPGGRQQLPTAPPSTRPRVPVRRS